METEAERRRYFLSQMNRMFATAVNVRTIGGRLELIAARVERMAINGLVLAARLPSTTGAPLVVLTRQLTALPELIGTEVGAINECCAQVTEETAKSGNNARLVAHYRTALSSVNHHVEMKGFDLVVSRASATLELCSRELLSAEGALYGIQSRLCTLTSGIRAARHVARCIAVESAWLPKGRGAFEGLSKEIHDTSNDIDQLIEDMQGQIGAGLSDVERLLETCETHL